MTRYARIKTAHTAIVSAVVALTLVLGWTPTAAQDKPVVLSWITQTTLNSATGAAFKTHFIDKLEARSGGRIVMQFRGGMDTVATMDQGTAVQGGLVDIVHPPAGFYEPLVPGVGSVVLSELTPAEERTPGGAFDYLVELHKKYGLMYLGRAYASPDFFYLGCNVKPRSREDFAKLRIGTATATQAAVVAWGATPVSLTASEYYPAMERGVVDCLSSTPLNNYADQGTGEVTKFIINKGFFVNSQTAIMNLDKWNSLPKDLQKLILDVMSDFENLVINDLHQKDLVAHHKKLSALGVELYSLPKEAEDWMVKTARDATWERQAKRFPDVTAKLRALFQRKPN